MHEFYKIPQNRGETLHSLGACWFPCTGLAIGWSCDHGAKRELKQIKNIDIADFSRKIIIPNSRDRFRKSHRRFNLRAASSSGWRTRCERALVAPPEQPGRNRQDH